MPERHFDFAKIALVTGSDSGIGRAIAVALARDGFDIGVTWHSDAAGAESTAAEVRACGAKAEVIRLDVAALPEGIDVLDALADRLGGIGVLVNCAGGTPDRPFLDITYDDWRAAMALNLDGPFLCAQWAAQRMVATGRGGRIINITSIHEHLPLVHSAHYASAKGGLGLLTKGMALELGAHGITVNAVAPGEIATAMTANEDVDPHTVDRPGIPIPRPGDAREVAAVVALLARPESAYVTGASWLVDGGMALMGPAAGHSLISDSWRSG